MTLFAHQLEVLKLLKNNNKGKIVLPTGTGKTLIQALDLANQIETTNGFEIFVVAAPRIMLAYQLLYENKKVNYGKNMDVRYLCVHSGTSPEDNYDLEILRQQKNIPYSEMVTTTSNHTIREQIKKAKKEDKPLIIFSTYNSSERILQGLGDEKINTTYCDEAHHLVREDFHMFLKKVKTDRLYFFTATEKYGESEDGMGMNNEATYGKVLYTMSPRTAIDQGLLLRPRMHIVTTEKNDYKFTQDLDKSFSNVVLQSYREHEFILGYVNAKMLVVVRKTMDMVKFIASQECNNLIESGVEIFAVSSRNDVGNWHNGIQMKRAEFLDKLKEIGSDRKKRMIVLHFDILTEGIDVSNFTGVLPFKGLAKIKFIQTYGRIGRLDPNDMKKIINGEINPTDLEKMYKPYGWIIIPELLFESVDNNKRIENLVHELRDYDFNLVDDLVISNSKGGGVGVVKGPEVLNEISKKSPNVGVFIDVLKSTIEDERIASLNNDDFVTEFF